MPANYLLHGNEKYLINEKINKIILDFEDENEEKSELLIIDDETSLLELKHHLTYNSLFTSAKVIVIKEPFWLKKKSRKSGQNRQALEIFQEYFAQGVLGQVLIVTSAELNDNSPIVKLFKKNAEIIPHKSMGEKALEKWLVSKLEEKGLRAESRALAHLLASGQDLYYLDNLLEKFALEGTTNITIQRLQAELDLINDANIFNLTDALISKKVKRSIEVLHHLIEEGSTPYSLIGMINNQFIAFAKVKAALEKGYNNAQIEKETALHAFVVRKMLKHTGGTSWDEVWHIFALLLDADLKIKTTSFDNTILLESLVVNICRK